MLVDACVIDGKIEPEAKARIASVRPDEQIILVFIYQVHTPQVTCFKGGIETEMTSFSLPTVTWRSHDHPSDVSEAAFIFTIFAI